MIEDSLSYHRFVLEMLVVKQLLGDSSPEVANALAGAGDHLRRQGALVGPLPQWGDWDEGRVLASSGDALDVEGSTRLALHMSGLEATDPDRVEVFRRAGLVSRRRMSLILHVDGGRGGTSGGLTHVQHGPWRVWFKVGLEHSHQQADLGHVSIQHDGRWLVIDPGTGTYNGPLKIRNAFRTSRGHNGLRVRGQRHLGPTPRFSLAESPRGTFAPALTVGETVVLFGVHDAFVETHDCRVARAVLISPDCRHMCGLAGETTAKSTDGGTAWRARLPSVWRVWGRAQGSGERDRGERTGHPFGGWVSSTYGSWSPAAWLDAERPSDAASWWAVANLTSPKVKVEGQRAALGGLELSIDFGSAGVVAQR